MELYSRFVGSPRRVGILAGSFNPPTVAHLQLVSAAAHHVDQVLCVVPQMFPHKAYFGATLEQRIEMLQVCGCPVAVSERGLFLEIAAEARVHFGSSTELYFLTGADAAERIIEWDYGRPGVAREMLQEFQILVAPRGKSYVPPEEFRDRVHELPIGEDFHEVSSTEIRERIQRRDPWEHLVPEAIVERVRSIYS
jgi:cytidyltransferase-like protein